MYIIGKANKLEIKEMKRLGFAVKKVDIKHFDMAMGDDGIVIEEDTDELVGIYLDSDIVQECRVIQAQENFMRVIRG